MTPERARINYAVAKTGLSKRAVQSLAQRGKIPGAAKLGSVWTFDKLKLARWIRSKECRTTSIDETKLGTPAFKWRAKSADGPLKRLIAQRQSAA